MEHSVLLEAVRKITDNEKEGKFKTAVTLGMPQNLHQWQIISHYPLSVVVGTQRTLVQLSGAVSASGTQYLNRNSRVLEF